MSGNAPLSMAMMRALYAVRLNPGHDGSEYRGGWRTIDALRRRKLVTVGRSGFVVPTELGNAIHLHEFRTVMHMDGCHYYSTAATCECGATYSSYGERDLKNDPYSLIWMEPQNGNEACLRCEDLIAGARPIYREQISEAKVMA